MSELKEVSFFDALKAKLDYYETIMCRYKATKIDYGHTNIVETIYQGFEEELLDHEYKFYPSVKQILNGKWYIVPDDYEYERF